MPRCGTPSARLLSVVQLFATSGRSCRSSNVAWIRGQLLADENGHIEMLLRCFLVRERCVNLARCIRIKVDLAALLAYLRPQAAQEQEVALLLRHVVYGPVCHRTLAEKTGLHFLTLQSWCQRVSLGRYTVMIINVSSWTAQHT